MAYNKEEFKDLYTRRLLNKDFGECNLAYMREKKDKEEEGIIVS